MLPVIVGHLESLSKYCKSFGEVVKDIESWLFAVGATVGMALAMRGGDAVIWSQHQDDFPYIKGMVRGQPATY